MFEKKGQINIEFVGGALLFFVAFAFIMNNVLVNFPNYSEKTKTSELEGLAWSYSDVLINEPGFWEDASGLNSGTDWEDPSNIDNIKQLGFSNGYHSIMRSKMERLNSVDYGKVRDELRQVLEKDIHFNLTLTEHIPVYTTGVFKKGRPPPGWNEPNDPDYLDTDIDIKVHYGHKVINGVSNYFLITRNASSGDYIVYIENSPDFSGAPSYNFAHTDTIEIGGVDYGVDKKILEESYGKIMAFQGPSYALGEVAVSERVIKLKRYLALEDKIIVLTLQMWQL